MNNPLSSNELAKVLNGYGVQVSDIKVVCGASVDEYRLYPKVGKRIRVSGTLSGDLSFDLKVKGIRIRKAEDDVALEIPNGGRRSVLFSDLVQSEEFKSSSATLPIIVGETICGCCRVANLASMPHLMVAGATKQGQKMAMNSMILSILKSTSPDDSRLVLIGPKTVELSAFGSLPDNRYFQFNGQNGIISTRQQALDALSALCEELERRQGIISGAGCLSISEYRDMRLLHKPELPAMPYIVCFFEDFSDYTFPEGNNQDDSGRNITANIIRLAQKGAELGIHMVLSTQRPSADVLAGIINSFPERLAFRTASKADSMAIIGVRDPESLIGAGDCLLSGAPHCERRQAPLVTDDDILRR